MPWTHCDTAEIPDDAPCPECGAAKEAWTLEFQVTREFRLRRAPALRLELLDAQEQGVSGEPYRVELPGGEVVEGELDEEGRAKHELTQLGECTITFTARARGRVVPYVPPEERDEGEAASAEPEEPEPEEAEGEPPSFSRPAKGRHVFQLRAGLVLQLTLFDEEGERPLPFASYTLEAEDGTRFEGRTDGRGRLDHGAVDAPRFTLTVTAERPPADPDDEDDEDAAPEELEATLVAPAVLPEDAFMRVQVPGVPAATQAPHELDDEPTCDRAIKVRVQTASGEPVRDVEYVLYSATVVRRGRTDADGYLIEQALPDQGDLHVKLADGRLLYFEGEDDDPESEEFFADPDEGDDHAPEEAP